jgi:hypothetical protein
VKGLTADGLRAAIPPVTQGSNMSLLECDWFGRQMQSGDRRLVNVPEYRRAIVEWCAGISAVAGTFAGIVAARVTTPLSRSPLFASCVVVALMAFAVLLVAGIPDFLGWLRGARRDEPAYWATVLEIRQRTRVLSRRRHELAMVAGFATGTEGYLWLAGEPWAGKTLLAETALVLRGRVDVIAYFASRREASPRKVTISLCREP